MKTRRLAFKAALTATGIDTKKCQGKRAGWQWSRNGWAVGVKESGEAGSRGPDSGLLCEKCPFQINLFFFFLNKDLTYKLYFFIKRNPRMHAWITELWKLKNEDLCPKTCETPPKACTEFQESTDQPPTPPPIHLDPFLRWGCQRLQAWMALV